MKKFLILLLFSAPVYAERIDYSSALSVVPSGIIAPRTSMPPGPKTFDDQQPLVTFDKRPPEVLMTEAKKLLAERSGNYEQAMANLRSIISTEPKENAKEAHELLGYAYEKSGNFEKAMREYNVWLALYPENGDDKTRVRQRLMSLEILEPTELRNAAVVKTKKPRQGDSEELTFTVSEYGYTSSTTPGASLATWHTDQISALTGLQATWKMRHNQYSVLGRVRLSDVRDFNRPDESRTNLSMAYVDFEDTFRGWGLRLGRQPPAAGAINRFDGLSYRVKIRDDTDILAVAGVPYFGIGNETARRLMGVEAQYRYNRDWAFSAYANRSLADGFLERMAIGGDVTYKNNTTSAIFRTEYDTVYHSLNLVSAQAFKYIGAWTVFGVYDMRRSPIPYADVALGIGGLSEDRQIYNSVAELLLKSGLSSADIYTYVNKTGAVASSAVVGVSNQLTKNWNLTGDFQVTNLSTVPGFNLNPQFEPVPIQVGQSNSYSANLHLRGENFLAKNNSLEVVVNDSFGSRKSYFVTVANNYRFGRDYKSSASALVRLDAYDRGYSKVKTLSGILRVLLAITESGMIEVQYSRALSYEPLLDLGTSPYSTAQNFYIGYRYDY